MGETVKSFEALVFAGVAAVLGTGFVVGAMLALLSDGATTALVLGNSVPVGTVVGVMLLLTTGALGTGQRWGRFVGVLSFGPVVAVGIPAVTSAAVLPVVYTGLAALATVYLLFRNPVANSEQTPVDESTSASKVGSTIR